MRSLAAASLGVASLVAAACAGDTEPEVAIASISPGAAYNEEKVSIVITGGPFRPVYDIDTNAGRASMELGSFTGFVAQQLQLEDSRPFDEVLWVSATELLGGLPKELPAGQYHVFIRDPRGHIARLDGGFTSLGPDGDAPIVTITQPPKGTIVLGSAEVPVAVLVSDGMGQLKSIRWSASTGDGPPRSGVCPVPPMTSESMCRFTVPTPEPTQVGQPLTISITAADWADNIGRGMTTLALSSAPKVMRVTPLEGPSTGGTEIVVRGANFVPGTQLLVDGVEVPLLSNEDPQTLTAKMPPHEPGFVTVSVRAGSAEVRAPSLFRFVGKPAVLAISPTSGPVTGGTRVAIVGKYFREGATRIFFVTNDGETERETELLCPKLVSPSRIEGVTPPNLGAPALVARDPVGGKGEKLPLAFTFLDVDTPDVAPPPPPICEGGML